MDKRRPPWHRRAREGLPMPSLTIDDTRRLMRLAQRLGRPAGAAGLLADAGVADDLVRLFDADFIGSTRWNAERRVFENARCIGRDDDMARQYVEQYQYEDPISPKARHARAPVLVRAVMPRRELERTRYFGDFLRPFRTVDGVDLYLYQGERNVGDVRIWRAPGRRPMGERETALLGLLQPHLLNALLGTPALAGADREAAERCRWPCFGPPAQPVNVAAEGVWRRLGEADAAALQAAIGHVARTGRPSTWHAYTLCAARAADGSALVQLVPAPGAGGAAHDLVAAFGLTPREAQVCALLAAGRSDREIGLALGMRYWTVRAHLRKVFMKFDVANRVDLARALGCIQPPAARH
jgi:DNA-binding CsgD family transcriptional regulator